MTSIVTGILSSTVGLLWNKARDSTAAKLKDGDITDAKIREIVVRELSDIKTKLDGLSRVNLLSSYRFLKEGVELLNVSLDKSKLELNAVTSPIQEHRGETSKVSSGVVSGILNAALELSHVMGKMKMSSDKELESAKERFKHARIRATDAFCNEALKIEDRIFAAKLRIVSEILECLDSPQTAISGCLSFLQDLHSLPAIREMFSVYLDGGIKSLIGKAERKENVKSVMLINYVLFNLNFKFSGTLTDRLIWRGAGIELDDRSFNPVSDWLEVSTRKSMRKELCQPPNELIVDEEILPFVSAVYSNSDVVVVDEEYRGNMKFFSRTGERKVVKLPELGEDKVIHESLRGLAVDNNDNLYVVKGLETRTESGDVKSYVLNVLDVKYNVKHVHRFYFFKDTDFRWVTIDINKNKNIVMIRAYDPHVYVCDSMGELKHKFDRSSNRDSRFLPSLSISNKNEIMMPSDDNTAVHFCTEEGSLKSTIQLPEDHKVFEVAFHHGLCKIIVLSYGKNDSFSLLSYSETGEMESSTFFCKLNDDGEGFPSIIYHPSGPVAVVRKKSITFI